MEQESVECGVLWHTCEYYLIHTVYSQFAQSQPDLSGLAYRAAHRVRAAPDSDPNGLAALSANHAPGSVLLLFRFVFCQYTHAFLLADYQELSLPLPNPSNPSTHRLASSASHLAKSFPFASAVFLYSLRFLSAIASAFALAHVIPSVHIT